MYNYVIFDLDGTLADTLEDLANAVNFALQENDLAVYPVAEYRFFVGSGVNRLIKKVMAHHSKDPVLVEKVRQDFARYYSKHSIDQTVSYPGVYALLKALNQKGVKLAVLSNKPHDYVGAILDKLFPDVHFEAAWGKKEEYEIKPNPQSLLAMMENIGAKSNNSLYVGDSDVDVKTAINAGIAFAGVEWGFRGREELREAGAKHTFDCAESLLAFIIKDERQ